MQFPGSNGHFKLVFINEHFYTFYGHKNGYSSFNNVRHMVKNQNLGNLGNLNSA